VHGLRQSVQRQAPDLLGILLGPADLRRQDGVLAGGFTQDLPLAAEHDGFAAGRANIQAYHGHGNPHLEVLYGLQQLLLVLLSAIQASPSFRAGALTSPATASSSRIHLSCNQP
jgi:hypothetical protein